MEGRSPSSLRVSRGLLTSTSAVGGADLLRDDEAWKNKKKKGILSLQRTREYDGVAEREKTLHSPEYPRPPPDPLRTRRLRDVGDPPSGSAFKREKKRIRRWFSRSSTMTMVTAKGVLTLAISRNRSAKSSIAVSVGSKPSVAADIWKGKNEKNRVSRSSLPRSLSLSEWMKKKNSHQVRQLGHVDVV